MFNNTWAFKNSNLNFHNSIHFDLSIAQGQIIKKGDGSATLLLPLLCLGLRDQKPFGGLKLFMLKSKTLNGFKLFV
jgi:hypothetical protein